MPTRPPLPSAERCRVSASYTYFDFSTSSKTRMLWSTRHVEGTEVVELSLQTFPWNTHSPTRVVCWWYHGEIQRASQYQTIHQDQACEMGNKVVHPRRVRYRVRAQPDPVHRVWSHTQGSGRRKLFWMLLVITFAITCLWTTNYTSNEVCRHFRERTPSVVALSIPTVLVYLLM